LRLWLRRHCGQLSARRARDASLRAWLPLGRLESCGRSMVRRQAVVQASSAHGSRPASASIAVHGEIGGTWARSTSSKETTLVCPDVGGDCTRRRPPPLRGSNPRTLPARSSTMKAVVASAGSRASALSQCAGSRTHIIAGGCRLSARRRGALRAAGLDRAG
jgi:hypothetical protein